MNSNNHLNPINYSDTLNVLLLGNGVNRAFDTGSWSDLLDDMSCNGYREEEREALKEIPYSLQAMVMTGDNVDEGVKHIAEKLIVTDNIDDAQRGLIRRLLSSHFDAVLTTNYTYDIEKSINPEFNCKISSRCKYRFSSVKEATRTEKQLGLYRYMNVDRSGIFPNIWHIHGEAGLPSSMVIGHYYYGKILYSIQNHIPTLIRRYKGMEKSNMFVPQSWVDYFMICNVYILGLGLDPSEIDLWWLINCKKRYSKKYNKKGIWNGEIHWFEPNLNSMDSFAKKQLAETCKIKYKTEKVGKKGYKKYYRDVVKDIEKTLANC